MNIQKKIREIALDCPDFIRFLKENDAFSEYFRNLRTKPSPWLIDTVRVDKEDLITGAFVWMSTNRALFWGKLSQKWSDTLICQAQKQIDYVCCN